MDLKNQNIESLKCSDIYHDEFENLLESDLDDIKEFLDSYIIKSTDNEKVEETIDILKSYMPKQEEKKVKVNHVKNALNEIKSSIELIKLNVNFISKTYIFISLMLMLSVAIYSINFKLDLYTCLALISPIPIVVGTIDLIKGKEENVWELELSYKYSFRQIIVTKLVIIEILAIVVGLGIAITSYNSISSINIIKLISSCIVPICIMTCISLSVVSVFRGVNGVGVSIATWIIGSLFIITNKDYQLSNTTLIIMITLVISLTSLYIKHFYNNIINYFDYKQYEF